MNHRVEKQKNINVIVGSTKEQITAKNKLAKFIRESNIPDQELLDNLGLYLTRQNISRILLMQKLYKKIIDVPGVVMEFGVRWGQNISLFQNFRGIYEPYNYNRKIIGFDTFSGFSSTHEKDGENNKTGDYLVTENWENELEDILYFHNDNSPINHKKKFELVKGNAIKTLPEYLKQSPHTVIAFAYFDFDIYEPTKVCLEKILPHLTRGSIIAFDEINCSDFPGETIALNEILGINNISLKRDPHNPLVAYFIYDV